MAKSQCVYCHAVAGTKDHIPPKCLFVDPKPALITVPSCRACNEGASKDDEYFRLVVSLREDLAEHPHAKGLIPPALRSIDPRRSPRFSRHFLRSLTKVALRTKAGLYVGHRGGYEVDLSRLERVARRVVIGLYFHEFQRLLAQGHTCEAIAVSALKGSKEIEDQVNAYIGALLESNSGSVQRNVFDYWYAEDATNDRTSWLLAFFGRIFFLVFTHPPSGSPGH